MLHPIVVGALDTNCWVVHDQGKALVVDPGDEGERILDGLAGLDVVGLVLTHAHWDHVLALQDLRERLDVPVLAHPAETAVWEHELRHAEQTGHWDAGTATDELLPTGQLAFDSQAKLWDGVIDQELADGDVLQVAGLTVIHTPGHTPGSLTFKLPGQLLTGDTLFPGGPGLTGWPLSDFPTIMRSVDHLLTTADHSTTIHPGHGRSTVASAERPHLKEWRARGW
ncbi:MBL fold metallo-hydrolase [Kribbella sp. NPDC026611]|uniref:MBL fold metallo-hydrolase n=1 Tax=Kribbella sp. NPDC026611 TaxID=3154911 RepID=UPI0033C20504